MRKHHERMVKGTSRRLSSLVLVGVFSGALGAASGALSADSVTIGVSAPQSGGGADYGTAFINGIRLAVKDLNEQLSVGGKKVELKVAICDDEFKSDKAANCARRLVSQDGAKIVVNPGTYATVPSLSFNQDKRSEFLVLGASGDPAVTNQNNKLFVRTWANVTRTMPGFVDTLLAYNKSTSAGIEKVALMEVNSDFGAAWISNFKKEWERHGKKIVGRAVYDQNGTDFYAQLTPLIAQKPDLIVLTTICEPSSLVIKQARELRYAGTFMNHGGCTGNQMLKLLPPKDIDGMLFESAPWTRDAPEITDFRTRYRAAFRIDPQIISAVGYLDIIWLVRAMEAAKSTSNASAIRAAMPGTLGKLRPNLLGWGNLDASGDIEWPMHISYVKNGVTQNFTGK
ncbi:MAG: hypothetical protein EPO20_08855 [Betaproteobacteria bacterium]|nr:MAG: hypothetical protein EPO20_08855 [Betaproteobacteria bacterium]